MLTTREIDILRWLAVGLTYGQTADRVKSSYASVYSHCCNIRRKAPVDTKSAESCRKFVQGNPELMKRATLPVVPSPRQLMIMELFAEGKSIRHIANDLHIGPQTVVNQLSLARSRAGIVSPHRHSDKVQEIRDYLAKRKATLRELTEPEASRDVNDY